MPVKPVPEEYSTLTPSASVRNCGEAIDYYKNVFGARERGRFAAPDGTIMHAELEIGDSILMLSEAVDKAFPLHAMLYVEDCDAVFRRAVEAGGKSEQEPANQFYGDRTGRVTDPFGNVWYIATHVEDVSDEELRRRFEAMTAQKQAAE